MAGGGKAAATKQAVLDELKKRTSRRAGRKQMCTAQMADFFGCLKRNGNASEKCRAEQQALQDCMAGEMQGRRAKVPQNANYQLQKFARALFK